MSEKIEDFKDLKFHPEEVLCRIAKETNNPIIRNLVVGLNPDEAKAMNGSRISKTLIQSVEDDAGRLHMLKTLGFPIDQFAGLLLHKREFRARMTFLRYLLSRAVDLNSSMDNVYYISLYQPLCTIVDKINSLFVGQDFALKADVRQAITTAMPYSLKLKSITATQILDNLFITNEKRMTVDGKKGTYIKILRPQTISDVVLDFLFFNEQHYSTVEDLSGFVDEYANRKHEFNATQSTQRALNSKESGDAEHRDDLHLAKARMKMEKSKDALKQRIYAERSITERAENITKTLIEVFRLEIKKFADTYGTIKKDQEEHKISALLPAA